MALIRPSGKAYIQILWTGSDMCIPSLFLFTDSKRYVFNCGEGIQRLFTQRKIKIGKLDTFFLTRFQWSHMGGLPGFGMTLRDMGSIKKQSACSNVNADTNLKNTDLKPNQSVPGTEKITSEKEDEINSDGKKQTINVFAPEGIKDIFDATKHFLRFDNAHVNFNVTEHLNESECLLDCYKDHEITVQSILLHNKNLKPQPDFQVLEDNSIKTVNISQPLSTSLCYICELRPLPGKFNVAMARKMGVPEGPLYGQLQKGEVVELDNGNIVKSEDVIGPEILGPKFLILDCPTELCIENLIQNSNLSKYLSEDERVSLVVHLSPKNVCQNSIYSKWVQKFPDTTKHIYMNNLVQESVAFDSQYCLQIMLNRVHSKIFPLTAEDKVINGLKNVSKDGCRNFMKVSLRDLIKKPSKAFDDSDVKSKIDLSALICKVNEALKGEEKNVENVQGKNDNHEGEINMTRKRSFEEDSNPVPHKKVNFDPETITVNSKSDNISIYPKVVCLGTGASCPSKYRNVSSTLVFLCENNAVLFDCGEGTYGQLLSHYGDNTDKILSEIKFIFISHMHADHHLGLLTLISKINSLNLTDDYSFIIMAPALLYKWLTSYANVSESIKFKIINCENAYQGISLLNKDLFVQPVQVRHAGCAHGVVLKYNQITKITYSGDTLPCDALIAQGRNSTLLIHEATLEDDMIEDAEVHRHSTTAQALEVAQKMNAEFVLLNHFSQRYPKIPIVASDRLSSNVCFAFDHMELSLSDFENFYELVPVLNLLFTEEEVV